MNYKGIRKTAFLLFLIFIFFAFTPLVSGAVCESEVAFLHSSDGKASESDTNGKAARGDIKISSRIYELFFKKESTQKEPLFLIPGGDALGIRIKEEIPTVTESDSHSPIKKGDKILSINEMKVSTPDEICELVRESGGRVMKIEVLRGGESTKLYVTPSLVDGEYRLGITLRRTASGIGTLTYIDPKTNAFGGLGHGVCDLDGTSLIDLCEGEVCSLTLGTVARGEVGKPGELSGILGKKHYGTILKNSSCGVFGVLEDYDTSDRNPIPVGRKSELRTGEAEIISTLRNGKTMHYKVEISDIDLSSDGSKSFKIKVVDPALIAISGGIVRGMSGSPIIQDGKLVGAVTHVLVANPTEGYGIFIENMLNAAENTVKKAA